MPLVMSNNNGRTGTLISDKEIILVEAWKRVLPTFSGDMDQSFFDLGGNSIKSIRVLTYCRFKGLSFELKDFFELQTIKKIAQKAIFLEKNVK